MPAILLCLFRLIWLFGEGLMRWPWRTSPSVNSCLFTNALTSDLLVIAPAIRFYPAEFVPLNHPINSISPNFANSRRQSVPIDSQRK
jgi:hypothetical protein